MVSAPDPADHRDMNDTVPQTRPRNNLAIAAIVVAGLVAGFVCLAAAALTQLTFFGDQPSPRDDHNGRLLLLGLPIIAGVATAAIGRIRRGGWGPVGPAIAGVGLALLALSVVTFELREHRIEQARTEARAWIDELASDLPDAGSPVEDRASLEDARSTEGSVSLPLVTDESIAERFDRLDPILRAAGAVPAAGVCDENTVLFTYDLADGDLVELRLLDRYRDRDEVTIRIRYARDGDRGLSMDYRHLDGPACTRP